MNFFKKISFLLFLSTILIPSFASADLTATTPELNPLCWKQEDCLKLRESFGITDKNKQAGGCIEEAPCTGKEWCKCLPAGSTSTSIAIGGDSSFLHLGEYMMVVFNYALIIAGVLAVLVIIVGGLQWLTSGGNSDTIGRAKKRIGGAFIGLFLAYGSFFILEQINPQLTSLRLPQVWMLKTQELMPTFCSELDDDTKLAPVAKADDQTSKITIPESGLTYTYTFEEAKKDSTSITASTNKMNWFKCGTRFLAKEGGSTECFGDFCAPAAGYSKMCVPNGTGNQTYICEKGTVAGTITAGGFIAKEFSGCAIKTFFGLEGWEATPIRSVGGPVFVCNGYSGSGTDIRVKSKYIFGSSVVKVNGSGWSYNIAATESQLAEGYKYCENNGGLYGIVIKVGMNEACTPDTRSDSHYIGKGGKDLGDTSFFIESTGAWQVNKKYYFTYEEIKKGVRLNINAGSIYDIDDESKEEYTKAGYYNLQ